MPSFVVLFDRRLRDSTIVEAEDAPTARQRFLSQQTHDDVCVGHDVLMVVPEDHARARGLL